jgi:hypothetical protein
LAALVHLAKEAERVARIGRHTVFPPLAALLELARAAETYHQSSVSSAKPVTSRYVSPKHRRCLPVKTASDLSINVYLMPTRMASIGHFFTK